MLFRAVLSRVPGNLLLRAQESVSLEEAPWSTRSRQFPDQMSKRAGRRPAWLGRKLLAELWRRQELYDLWQQGQAGQEDNRVVVHRCREKTRKGRAQLELKLASALSDTKKDSLKYTDSKEEI